MGGGDSLYDKIDRGMRGCKAVVSCVTQKYSLSANCRREVSLADALKKPVIPLLLEQMKWPPDGPMSMVFTELLYINFYKDEAVQMVWKGEQFNELKAKLGQFVPNVVVSEETEDKSQGKSEKPNHTKTTMRATIAGKSKEAQKDKERNSIESKKVEGKPNTILAINAIEGTPTILPKEKVNKTPPKGQNKITQPVKADIEKQVAISLASKEKSKAPREARENSVESKKVEGKPNTILANANATEGTQTILPKEKVNKTPPKSQNKITQPVKADNEKQVAVSLASEENSKATQEALENKMIPSNREKIMSDSTQKDDSSGNQLQNEDKRVQPPGTKTETESYPGKRNTSAVQKLDKETKESKSTKSDTVRAEAKMITTKETSSAKSAPISSNALSKTVTDKVNAKDTDLRSTGTDVVGRSPTDVVGRSPIHKSSDTDNTPRSSPVVANNKMTENKQIYKDSTDLKKNFGMKVPSKEALYNTAIEDEFSGNTDISQKTPKVVHPEPVTNKQDSKKSSTCTII